MRILKLLYSAYHLRNELKGPTIYKTVEIIMNQKGDNI